MWLKHAKPIVAVAPILDGSAASFPEARQAGIALLDHHVRACRRRGGLPSNRSDKWCSVAELSRC